MTQEKKGNLYYNEYFPQYAGRTFGFMQADFQERVNMDRMRRERLERTRAYMKKENIPVILLINNGNMRYATAYTWLAYTTGGAYALVPLEGDPVIFGHTISALQDRRQMPWIKPENMRFYVRVVAGGVTGMVSLNPPADEVYKDHFGKQIKRALEEMKLDKEVLTLDTHIPMALAALEKIGIRTAVNENVMARAQEIKTQDEIDCFRQCALLADLVHYELAKYAEPGKTERELAGHMDFVAMKYGAEPTPNCFVASGQHTHPNYRYSTDKMLRPGDIFFADTIQISWNGYKSCCYRNYSVIKPPSQAAKDANKRLIDLVYNALEDCKPGNTTADMMKHWPPMTEYPGPAAGNGMHGLGLQNYGPPWGSNPLSLQHPYELKEGMVFAIEPELGIGDGQGLRLEEMVVITNTGCEVLTHAPLEILICPLR